MKNLIIAMKQILQSDSFWIIVAIIILVLIALLCEGCAAPKADLTPGTDKEKRAALKDEKIIEKIYETNLLVSGFIVVSAIGVFCCFSRQLQLGLALIATGGAGIWITRADQSLAQNQWFLLIPTGLVVVGGGIWVFKNEQVRTALREIVGGVNRLKPGTLETEATTKKTEAYEMFKAWQKQSKPTEKIVSELKAKL